LGFKEGKTQTLKEWIDDQDMAVYNKMNDMLMEVISLKNRLKPGTMDLKSGYLFNMACYDLDRFRSHILDQGLLDDLKLNSDTLYMIRTDDVALLKLGLQWIKRVFCGTE